MTTPVGFGASAPCPVGISLPVPASIRHTATLSLSTFSKLFNSLQDRELGLHLHDTGSSAVVAECSDPERGPERVMVRKLFSYNGLRRQRGSAVEFCYTSRILRRAEKRPSRQAGLDHGSVPDGGRFGMATPRPGDRIDRRPEPGRAHRCREDGSRRWNPLAVKGDLGLGNGGRTGCRSAQLDAVGPADFLAVHVVVVADELDQLRRQQGLQAVGVLVQDGTICPGARNEARLRRLKREKEGLLRAVQVFSFITS